MPALVLAVAVLAAAAPWWRLRSTAARATDRPTRRYCNVSLL
jgi:hypothetical protein